MLPALSRELAQPAPVIVCGACLQPRSRPGSTPCCEVCFLRAAPTTHLGSARAPPLPPSPFRVGGTAGRDQLDSSISFLASHRPLPQNACVSLASEERYSSRSPREPRSSRDSGEETYQPCAPAGICQGARGLESFLSCFFGGRGERRAAGSNPRCREPPVMVAASSQPEALPDGCAAEPVYLVWEEDGELLVCPGLLHLQRPL